MGMNDEAERKVHRVFWIIGISGLIWNLMGIMNFLWQINMSADTLATLSEAQRAIIDGRPLWVTVAFAVAVVAGAIGCVLLLLKKPLALALLVLSLLAVLVSMIPVFGMMGKINFTTFERVMYLVATPALAAFLVWYTRRLIAAGQLR